MDKIDHTKTLNRFDHLVIAVTKKYEGNQEELREKGLKGLGVGIYEYMRHRRNVAFEAYLLYFIKLYIEKK